MSLMVRERGRVGRLGVCIVLVGAGIRRLGTNEKNILDREKSEKAVLMRFESVFFCFFGFGSWCSLLGVRSEKEFSGPKWAEFFFMVLGAVLGETPSDQI